MAEILMLATSSALQYNPLVDVFTIFTEAQMSVALIT